jgi:NAD(P)-dependent dehydrogenase (short-subunit alcohol dehydrogenase family)
VDSRTVVVTGGSCGIGRAVAARFVADGAEVVITGRRADVLKTVADEIGARGVVCDGTDPVAVEQALTQFPERIDVLVNNAGGNTDFVRPEPHDLSQLAANWQANLATNVLTAVLTTTALSDRLADGGTVVLLGSIAADRGSGGGSYGAAKAALGAWNLDLSAELGARGITSNVISPGYVAETEFFGDRMTDERRASLLAATRNKREGSPADIAETVFFLASPGARHITGQVLNVNGGAVTTR